MASRFKNNALLCGVAGGITALTLFLSPQFVAGTIGGPTAVKHHNQKFVSDSIRILNQAEERLNAKERQLGEFNTMKDQITVLRDCELERGCVSGRGSGPGSVTEDLTLLMGTIQSYQPSAKIELDAQKQLLANTRDSFSSAREAILAKDSPAFQKAASDVSNKLSRVIGASETQRPDLSMLTASPHQSLKDLGQRYAANVSAVNWERLQAPVYEALHTIEAVNRYPETVSAAINLAYAVELLPLALFLVVLAHAITRPREAE
jgi:hypothetical protein